MKKVLIAGGSGFIGRRISSMLLEKGYEVAVLSRSRKPGTAGIRYFYWDIAKEIIENGALDNTAAVINLAGANIAAGRWTSSRKKAIAESRIRSTGLLVRYIQNAVTPPAVYISASATGYYGSLTSQQIFTEQDKAGTDFLSDVCARWEAGSASLTSRGIRRIILRTGVVMSKEEGLLKKVLPFVKAGISPVPGSDKQWLPWIHIEDIAAMYVFALEQDHVSGIYNACVPAASQPDYSTFIKTLARQLNRAPFMPHIPGYIFKLMLGEMAAIILNGSRASGSKILEAGYSVRLSDIREML